MKKVIAVLFFSVTVGFADAQAWLPCGEGTMSTINSMAADTIHNRLFVSGVFSTMDTLTVNHIAIWDGNHWSKFIHNGGQVGMTNTVSDVFVWNDYLYMVMNTGSGGNQAIYRTSLDTFDVQLVYTFNGSLSDLVVYHDTLYVCGDINGMMSKWDGTNWISVTGGLGVGTGFGLYDMEVYNDKIYVVGNFEITSPYVTKDVAAYNNGVWEDVGSNLVANLGNNGTWVYAVKAYHNKIYIGGEFDVSDGSPEQGLLVLQGGLWSTTGIQGTGIRSMTCYKDKFFIGGSAIIPLVPNHVGCVVTFDSLNWTYAYYNNVCAGGLISGFEIFQDKLYAGGHYDAVVDSVLYAESIMYLDPDTAICYTPVAEVSNDTLTVSGTGTIQWINCDNGSIISGATSNTFIPPAFGNYAAIVNDGTCTDTSACVSYTGVRGDLIMVNGVTVYPNPANESVTVKAKDINKVQITNLLGQLIETLIFKVYKDEATINISGLPQGIYLVRVQTSSGWSVAKIVKE